MHDFEFWEKTAAKIIGAGSESRLAGSAAWHGLPQCPGYGHSVSYRSVVLVFGFEYRGSPAIPWWGLGCVCSGTGLTSPGHSWLGFVVRLFGFGFRGSLPFLAGVQGVCFLRTVLGFAPPILGSVCGACVWVRGFNAPCYSWLGVGGVPSGVRSARTLPLRAGAACVDGLCGSRRARGSPPPSFFFRPSWLRRGTLRVWRSALLCCGSVEVAVVWFRLGPTGPRSPSPLRYSFFFC